MNVCLSVPLTQLVLTNPWKETGILHEHFRSRRGDFLFLRFSYKCRSAFIRFPHTNVSYIHYLTPFYGFCVNLVVFEASKFQHFFSMSIPWCRFVLYFYALLMFLLSSFIFVVCCLFTFLISPGQS